jgi:hypothetical protein
LNASFKVLGNLDGGAHGNCFTSGRSHGVEEFIFNEDGRPVAIGTVDSSPSGLWHILRGGGTKPLNAQGIASAGTTRQQATSTVVIRYGLNIIRPLVNKCTSLEKRSAVSPLVHFYLSLM